MDGLMLRIISISKKGQITIPKEIQEMLGIKKGDHLVITAKNKKILIQKAANIEADIGDDFTDLVEHSNSSLRRLWNNKRDNVWDAYLP